MVNNFGNTNLKQFSSIALTPCIINYPIKLNLPILRSLIYSNPSQNMVREIPCNSTHKEQMFTRFRLSTEHTLAIRNNPKLVEPIHSVEATLTGHPKDKEGTGASLVASNQVS